MNESSLGPEKLAALAADATSNLENGTHSVAGESSIVGEASQLKRETTDAPQATVSHYPDEGLLDPSSAHGDAMDLDPQPPPTQETKTSKPRKPRDADKDARSTIHSSKNEGQHTDKRVSSLQIGKD